MEEKNFTERIIDGLRNAATELEELRVQVALGKAEATDKYHEAKKKINLQLHNAKAHLDNSNEYTQEATAKAKTIFEQFVVHIKSLEGESAAIVNKADEKIKGYVDELEKSLKK